MPVCPRAPGVQLPLKSDMELPVPYKRCAYNLTCYGLLRPVTANGDGRQFTDGDLVRLPADSVVFVGNGVGGCSLTNSHGATLSTRPRMSECLKKIVEASDNFLGLADGRVAVSVVVTQPSALGIG